MRRALFAAHEAGHAVALMCAAAALALPDPPFIAIIIGDDRADATVSYGGNTINAVAACVAAELRWDDEPFASVETRRQVLEWTIIAALAGPFAEAAFDGRKDRRRLYRDARKSSVNVDDYEYAKALLSDHRRETGLNYPLRCFERRAARLVSNEKAKIEGIAAAVMAAGFLSYDDALKLPCMSGNGCA